MPAKKTDQEILLKAVYDARRILAGYISPGPRDCEATINQVLAILDDEKVTSAIKHLNRRLAFKMIEPVSPE